MGDKAFHPYFLGLLAESYGADGYPAAGLEALAEAMAVMDATEVYGWFTEGFDTADLKEPKNLLEELG